MQINEFPQKQTPVGNDLILIWDSEAQGTKQAKLSSISIASGSSNSSKTFSFLGLGDKRGLIYNLGSNNFQRAYINPATNGLITTTQSSNWSNTYPVSNLFDRSTGTAHTANTTTEWFRIDLGATRNFLLKAYTLKGRTDDNSQHPRNWKLQGSVNGTTWVDIDSQIDNSVINLGTWGFFDTVENTTFYRYFRLLQTGLNSSSDRYFVLGEWELYGMLQ